VIYHAIHYVRINIAQLIAEARIDNAAQ